MPRGFLDEDSEAGGDFGALDNVREFAVTGKIVGKENGALLFHDGVRQYTVPASRVLGSEQADKEFITLRVPEWWARQQKMMQ